MLGLVHHFIPAIPLYIQRERSKKAVKRTNRPRRDGISYVKGLVAAFLHNMGDSKIGHEVLTHHSPGSGGLAGRLPSFGRHDGAQWHPNLANQGIMEVIVSVLDHEAQSLQAQVISQEGEGLAPLGVHSGILCCQRLLDPTT